VKEVATPLYSHTEAKNEENSYDAISVTTLFVNIQPNESGLLVTHAI